MTYQCLNCGSQTRAGAKFCHLCGTPIATTSLPPTMPIGNPPPTAETRPQSTSSPAAPRTAAATEAMSAPTAYIPQTPQTYHTPMPVQPSTKSRGGFKIVLITLAIIFALGIASVIGAVFFVRNKVREARKNLPSIPAVRESADSVPDEKLGVPIFPGAKRGTTKSADFMGYSGLVVEFTTDASIEKVANFYRDQFRGKDGVQSNQTSDEDEEKVVFTLGTNQGPRIITITPDSRNPQLTKFVILGGNLPGSLSGPQDGLPGHPPVEVPPLPPGAPPPPPPAPPRR